MFSFVPPPGKRYHLFDTSVLLIGISLLWYITTAPSRTTVKALDETILGVVFSPALWGWSLLIVGLIGVVASFVPRWLDAGYMIVAFAIALWGLAILVGTTFALITDAATWESAGKSYGISLWFGYSLRGLVAPLFRHGTVTDADPEESM